MVWETPLVRLLLQQVHNAEKGEAKVEAVVQQVEDFVGLAPDRPGAAFLCGYATRLLDVEIATPGGGGEVARRWALFGRLRACDRKGQREQIAEVVKDPQALLDLLTDAVVAGNVLPLVVRSLFWSGDVKAAVRAIQFLAAEANPQLQTIVDAAVTDLLTRLESRVDTDDQESTASIIGRILGLASFDRLPDDVQARYQRALAERLLAASEWDLAIEAAECAIERAGDQYFIASAASVTAALAEMRQHDPATVEPHADRPEREAVLERLQHVADDPDHAVPEALYLRSLMDYESGDLNVAAKGFERALAGLRRLEGRDLLLRYRARFFAAAALLAVGDPAETSRALKLMEQALETVQPDLETFYSVHEALKKHDRKLALRFLDAVDVGRGSSPDQLLFVALEYQGLGEAESALRAACRVLEVAVDLDQRIEALRVVMTAHNMLGEREQSRACYAEIRELLLQRGRFEALETLLHTEEFVGQALDHLEIKIELVAVLEEMEGRDYESAQLKVAIARSLRARKDADSLRQAYGLLEEVGCTQPELVNDELAAVEKLLALDDSAPAAGGAAAAAAAQKSLGRPVRVLVVGGNERQRRHHARLTKLASEWQFEAEWLETNYTSPQKTVSQIKDRMGTGLDVLLLLHWNRHETTEPALELARDAGLAARTVSYAGFTSLQVALADQLERLAGKAPV
ncbi:MAG: hypothetical protein NXI31_26105 [bacterium]|nr:hypothetical protein [bacterium]